MEDDGWDLQAVVRGYRGAASTGEAAYPFLFLPPVAKQEVEEEEDVFGLFSEVFPDQRGRLDELEELCKPFCTKSMEPKPQIRVPSPKGKPSCLVPSQTAQNQRAKRRKNPQKKEVRHVPAGSASPDVWAWRKYGQKPIKGSPYPRGYYRCSSSKGCMARKQMERSKTDPETLIITYTGEHNHPVPVHRNSLAGSSRQKFPSSSSSSFGSPTTPLASSVEDEQSLVFGEDDDDEENLLFLEDVQSVDDFMWDELSDCLSQSLLSR